MKKNKRLSKETVDVLKRCIETLEMFGAQTGQVITEYHWRDAVGTAMLAEELLGQRYNYATRKWTNIECV